MARSIPLSNEPSFSITELQDNLERIRDQILVCVAEAAHYVKHVELLDKKVQTLAIEEEKLVLLLEKLQGF